MPKSTTTTTMLRIAALCAAILPTTHALAAPASIAPPQAATATNTPQPLNAPTFSNADVQHLASMLSQRAASKATPLAPTPNPVPMDTKAAGPSQFTLLCDEMATRNRMLRDWRSRPLFH